MREIAYAKINLALHVRERRPDGYHRIETLFAFAEDGDVLTVGEADDLRLEVSGAFAGALTGENLVLRAAAALRERFGVARGALLRLDKRLPVAAGIGGGSADAAAALRLLGRWWGLEAAEQELLEIAAALGADVPACLLSRTARGTGRGDDLVPLDDPDVRRLPLLLVNPRVPVDTGPVFAGWDRVDCGPLEGGTALASALSGRNDLEAPALALAPAIGEVLGEIAAMDDVLLGRMSGSGGTCFALFRNEADRDRASEQLSARQPNWWQLSTRLR
jgi:4-diphosphocytidyl-2-C-methyl-D-erythritol kinase